MPAGIENPGSVTGSNSRPGRNVHEIGWRSQASLPRYYRSFDAILIPYLRDHPFNTGLLSDQDHGRHGIGPADRGDGDSRVPAVRGISSMSPRMTTPSLAAVESMIENGSDDGRAGLRHSHARENTCALVAMRVAGDDRHSRPSGDLDSRHWHRGRMARPSFERNPWHRGRWLAKFSSTIAGDA